MALLILRDDECGHTFLVHSSQLRLHPSPPPPPDPWPAVWARIDKKEEPE